ncbi:MAG TPA: aminotransferase class I/II-fold pyridoxal phosphate-dependent enzyme, partial [Solirubrobacterales bacterium]|nr:aminotransferase class I/II-fold pyridoxal phosphate-dependent enzyme [Solirubrobacterales bacterium]
VAALVRPGEVVFSDQLNHPGIVAGCRLSGADVFVYDHRDTEHLAWGLRQARGAGALIVTESVFAVEGDLAPLESLIGLARDHDCLLLAEESHAIGAVGPEGRGLVAAFGLTGEVDVVVASLGKALGSYGSFAACAHETAEFLASSSASLLCSSAPPPAATAAAAAALELLIEHPYRVERLRANSECLREALSEAGVRTGPSRSQVVTVPAGDGLALGEARERALAAGVLVGTVQPPQLPVGEAALRLSVMATHRGAELRAAAQVIADASRGAGIAAAAPLRAVSDDWTDGAGWTEAPATAVASAAAGEGAELPTWIRAA